MMSFINKKNVPIRKLLERILLLTMITFIVITMAVATYISRTNFKNEFNKYRKVEHETLSALFATPLFIDDYAEVRRQLNLLNREDVVFALITYDGDVLLSDYTMRGLVESSVLVSDSKNIKNCNSITNGRISFIYDDWQVYCSNIKSSDPSLSEISNGKILGVLISYYKGTEAPPLFSKIFLVLLSFTVVILILSLFFFRIVLIRNILRPLEKLVKVIRKKVLSLDTNTILESSEKLPAEIEELRHAFNELIISINKHNATKREYEKLATIGQMTQILAHDVRKPFSQLKIVLNMFDVFKSSPSQLNRAKIDIEKSIANVNSMLDDIMDFSREVKLETKPCPLGVIFDFSIRQTAQTCQRSDIDIIYDLSHTYKPLIDDERFARVCTNIITNAVEAINIMDEKSKGTIIISTRDITRSEQRFVEIIIANNGPRLNEEDFPCLFSSFFTKGKRRGTGLGLASAYKIVMLHEGIITARNMDSNKVIEYGWNENKGVEFVINIPTSDEYDVINLEILPKNIKEISFSESKENKNQIDSIIDSFSRKRKQFKILLLEDEALYRASVKNTIRKNESLTKILALYDVSTVEEALAVAEQEHITHAIVDIDLGQARNGFDFIEEIKIKHPQILCMVHSNRHLDEDVVKAKSLGAKAYVPKPLNIENLVSFLAEDEINNM